MDGLRKTDGSDMMVLVVFFILCGIPTLYVVGVYSIEFWFMVFGIESHESYVPLIFGKEV